MKKRIYRSLCITSILLVLLCTMLTMWSFYGVLMRQASADLTDEYSLLKQSLALVPDKRAYLEGLNIRYKSFRVTLVSRDGAVLFDSDNELSLMENHQDRPEIIEAFDTGKGQDVRRSRTMGLDTYYYAERLDDGTVLRVSKQASGIGTVFMSIIPVMAGILLLILFFDMAVSSHLTNRLLRPVKRLAEDIENTETLGGYEELEPFLLKIKEQNRLIREQMEHLREERDTIKTITSNMKEGLILLDLEHSILSVNRSALALLDVKEADFEGKSILNLSRSPELNSCIEQAMQGEGSDAVIVQAGRACQLSASPVYGKQGICGAIVLLLDVTERQKAEKIRRDFTANVSHELKTPLTSISGFAEMIENGMVAEQGEIQQFAGRIYREASRLITLTDDIIRLSRIEEHGKLSAESVELRALCEGIVSALQFTAEQKQVNLSISGERMTVSGNACMLEELVYNLTENAIKYNRPDGKVHLSLRQEGQIVCIIVEDTGIGIGKEHQGRIFERFYRVDQSRSKQTGGTGLGLSIVKHIVERHSGSITLESEPQKGTSVTVRLPMQQI